MEIQYYSQAVIPAELIENRILAFHACSAFSTNLTYLEQVIVKQRHLCCFFLTAAMMLMRLAAFCSKFIIPR